MDSMLSSLAYLLYEPPHDKTTKIAVHTAKTHTVNPLYNVGVGPRWFMTLKWICRCNDLLLFRPRADKMQNKCAAISTWFAMSESLISNSINWLKHVVEQYFRIKFFDKYMYLFLRNNSAKARILAKPAKIQAFSEDFSSRKWQWLPLTFTHGPLEHLMNN